MWEASAADRTTEGDNMAEAAGRHDGDIIDFRRSIRYMPGVNVDLQPGAPADDTQELATVTELQHPVTGERITDENQRVVDWASASVLEHQTLPAGYMMTADGTIITPANLEVIDWAASTGMEDQPFQQ